MDFFRISLLGVSSVLFRKKLPAACLLLAFVHTANTANAEQYAFLVGVRQYDRAELQSLRYTENDVTRLADVLQKKLGYRSENIVLMTQTLGAGDTRYLPISTYIRKEFKLLVGELGPQDSILVSFSGHGVQFEGSKEIYFCPADARLKDRTTLISLGDVFRQLEACRASARVLLVDACRNDPQSAVGKTVAGVELEPAGRRQLVQPPGGVAAFYSCSAGEQSFELPKLKHGIFLYEVIRGLEGRADFDEDGEITLTELKLHVVKQVRRTARLELGRSQTPELLANVRGLLSLGRHTEAARPMPDRPKPNPPRIARPHPASELKPGEAITNSIGMKLFLIPPGEFLMGSPENEEGRQDNEPQHQVRISQPYYVGAHEVTVGQFRQFVEATGYETEAESPFTDGGIGWDQTAGKPDGPDQKYDWQSTGFEQTDEHPVVNVTWNDAVAFCRWLSSEDGKDYRLPTEAEWEYACRGGTTSRYFHGENPEELVRVGNVADAKAKKAWKNINDQEFIQGSDDYVFSAPVGTFEANDFGLFDMQGNVWEWCQDRGGNYATKDLAIDPSGPEIGSLRINRGGGWNSSPSQSRAAARGALPPTSATFFVGFRVVAELDSKTGNPAEPIPDASPAVAKPYKQLITNSIGMQLALIPAGEFLMGSHESAEEVARLFNSEASHFTNEHPQHRVEISKSFYLGVHEVTVGQFRKFVTATDYQTEAETNGEGGVGWNETAGNFDLRDRKFSWRSTGFQQTDDHPVVNVTWSDAVEFCRWLSREEGKKYRLPTEAEWEYACRSGTKGRYFNGEDPDELTSVGNVADASAKAALKSEHGSFANRPDGYTFTAPIGTYRANAWGLYDMHGNVVEWCHDWYAVKRYANSPTTDPGGTIFGSNRVCRGGSWFHPPADCRAARRFADSPSYSHINLGFRVVAVPSGE